MSPERNGAGTRARGLPGPVAVALFALAMAAPAILPLGCGPDAPPVSVPGPAPPPPVVARGKVSFTDLHEDATGFGPLNHTGVPNEKQWIAEAMFGGLTVLDYDGDGDVDIFFADGNRVGGDPVPGARCRLFRNDGGMRFTETTEEAGIDITRVCYGGGAADFDGDGDVDIFVPALGKNSLLRNDGDGTFTDVAEALGVAGPDTDMSTMGSWGDLDGDGRLDLYVSNYIDMNKVIEDFRKEGRVGRSCDWRGYKVYCGPPGLPFQRDRLFLQREDGTFEDASDRLRDQVPRPGFQSILFDFDGDGDLDVYVANDTEANSLWVNDGRANFRDEGMIAGCALSAGVNAQAGMGVDAADYDGDGLVDLVVTNFSHDHYTLYRNQRQVRKDGSRMPVFEDVSIRTGISQATYIALGWAALFQDFDRDGDADLFFTNGHVYGEIANFPETGTSFQQRNLYLENGEDGGQRVFRDASDAAGPGLRVKEVHRGAVLADLDDDGDMDMVVSVLNGKAYILRNDTAGAPPAIRVRLVGKAPRDPAGALVRVEAEGLPLQARPHLLGHSFLGTSDPRMDFAAGPAGRARVTVTWPSGKESVYPALEAGGTWILEEGGANARRGGATPGAGR